MNRRTALIFYVISAYVVLQFVWWGYHLIELTNELAKESSFVESRVTMILGEGFVFLLLLLLGVWQIRRSIRKELKLTERQNNFLLSVTHELKTPLAANKLYLQTLLKRNLDKDKQVEFLTKAIEENARLDDMINNILNASQLENKALHLQKEDVNLTKLINEITTRHNSISDSKRVFSSVKTEINVFIDRFIVETILNNLVENALKYSGEKELVEIYASTSASGLEFGVKDDGIGISREDKSAIFNKFFRVGNEEVRTKNGTGLGLFIVAELVKIHLGTIACGDNSPKGTNFQIKLKNG